MFAAGRRTLTAMGDGISVLVVDDNAANRALAAATLEDEGYRVVLAAGGEAGVVAFARERPDCVLLDVLMPGVDGPTACRQMRALPGGTDVPIVFVTALRDVDTFDRALLAGGDDFLTKPFRPSELVARVVAAVKLRRLAAERSDLYNQVKQQRDALVRLQLQKEELVAYVVHDLKNPVNAIALQAELLRRDRDGSPRGRRAGDRIADETRTLLRMITTLLDLAKADAGQLEPVRCSVEVAPLVAGVVDELGLRAEAAGVSLVRQVDAVTIHADPGLLRRVLENLIDNAIRHAPETTSVVVSARAVDRGVELRVADRGAGIAADRRAHVFERFSGGGHGDANRGLGLAFCKLAIEAHGGQIWIEDAGPGAVFCLRIDHDD